MNRTINGKIGDKVKFINIVGNPVGTITDIYIRDPDAGSLSGCYLNEACWVRLESGMLLKDVLPEEII